MSGALCHIKSRMGRDVLAEVVGFRDKKFSLMPIGDMSGIGPDSTVVAARKNLEVGVGQDLLGRVFGQPGKAHGRKGPINIEKYYPVENTPPNPMKRPRINQVIPLGVKCIDGLLTVGKGQRLGIFAGSGVGKSYSYRYDSPQFKVGHKRHCSYRRAWKRSKRLPGKGSWRRRPEKICGCYCDLPTSLP